MKTGQLQIYRKRLLEERDEVSNEIKHHLRNNITSPENTILFVGFQANGTLGRIIVDGKPEVRIHGENYHVRAEIAQIHGASAHADRSNLMRWLGNLKEAPRRVFLTHGEEDVSFSLAAHIGDQLGWQTSIPTYREEVELS